jgi:hypothetical protein
VELGTNLSRANSFLVDFSPVSNQQEELFVPQSHKTRKRRELSPKYVEAMITIDKVSYDYYKKGTLDFVLAVANMVSKLRTSITFFKLP